LGDRKDTRPVKTQCLYIGGNDDDDFFFCGFSQFSSLRVPLVATATSVISLAAASGISLPGLSWKLAVRTSFLSAKKKTHTYLETQ